MNWKHDPNMSGADYFALARKRARTISVPSDLDIVLQWDGFDYGVHRAHVRELMDPMNWSAEVLAEGRKPRVFIDAYVNQSGNAEIRSIGGSQKIYFAADFARSFIGEAISGHYGHYRSTGEIMWIRELPRWCWYVVERKNPVAKALLFGSKSRLDELIANISAVMDVVGAMPLQFEYDGKNVAKVDFAPTISREQIRTIKSYLWE